MRIGLAAQLHGPAVHVPPQELLLSRHAEGVPDQPVRRAAQRRRLARPRRRVPRRHRAGAHGGGHRQVDPRRRLGRPDPRQRALADRLQPGRGAARRDRQPARHPHAEQASEYVSELRAILVADRCVRRQDGRGLDACRRQRQRATSRATPLGTRCEIKNLNSVRSVGRAIEYEARRQVGMLEAGEIGPPGDPALGRERRSHAHAALQGGRRRLPLLPRARPRPVDPDPEWIERVRAALPVLPAARRERLAAATGAGGRQRGRDGRGRPRPGRLRARGAATPAATRRARSCTSRRRSPSRAPQPSVPAGDLAKLTQLEIDGKLTSTQAKQVLADLVAGEGGDAEAIAAARGFEAMDTSELESMVDDGDRRPAGRVGEVPCRRGQGDRRARRRRDEGIEGAGRRQGRHRHPPRRSAPERRGTACARPLVPRSSAAAVDTVSRRAGFMAPVRRWRRGGSGDRDPVGVSRRERADDRRHQHVGGGERTEIGPVDELEPRAAMTIENSPRAISTVPARSRPWAPNRSVRRRTSPSRPWPTRDDGQPERGQRHVDRSDGIDLEREEDEEHRRKQVSQRRDEGVRPPLGAARQRQSDQEGADGARHLHPLGDAGDEQGDAEHRQQEASRPSRRR